MKRKGILLVSFGSSYLETRTKTLDRIEEEVRLAHPDAIVYHAFTSERIRKLIWKREQKQIPNVVEAMKRFMEEEVQSIIIQPTFITDGSQNQQIQELVKCYREAFEEILVGKPLLYSIKDYQEVVGIFHTKLPKLEVEEAVLAMGHGEDEKMSISFAALDYMFKEQGYEQIYLATINGYPSLSSVIKQLKSKAYKKVSIIPFMVVAGYHAKKDMLELEEKSWKAQLEKEGYEVKCYFKGLGEYSEIRQMYQRHIEEAMPL